MPKFECKNPEAVAKRAFYLAWQACGGPLGMGILQDRGEQSEEQVWDGVFNRSDYPGGNKVPGFANKTGDVYGDYVFGRMMKLHLKFDEEAVEYTDGTPRPDYQAWCTKYPTYQSLIEAAIDSLEPTKPFLSKPETF